MSEDLRKWGTIERKLRERYTFKQLQVMAKIDNARKALNDLAIRQPNDSYLILYLEQQLDLLERELAREREELEKFWDEVKRRLGVEIYVLE